MREGDKARLDRLQAELTARVGEKVTQEELLARLVALGEQEKDRLLLAPAKARSAEEIWQRMLSCIVKTGVRTREEDIDRILYGQVPD